MIKRTYGRRHTLLAVAVALVIIGAVGCSSTSHPAASTNTGATNTTVAVSGAPVKIGFLDIEGSLGITFKPQRVQAQQLVSYLNSKGGIGGHPIDLVYCVTQSASGGANCANQMVQDHAVLVMDWSVIDSAGIYPILKSAGIPVFGGGNSPLDAADLTPDGNHWFVSGGALVGFETENLFIADTLKLKSIGLLVGSSGAAQEAAMTFIEKPLKALGVTTTAVNIQESNPDYTAPLDTVSNSAGLEILTGCSTSDEAIKQASSLGYKGAVFGCLDPTDIAAIGSASHGMYGGIANVIPSSAEASNPDVATFLSLEKQYGWDYSAASVYELVVTAVNLIEKAGGATATGLQVRSTIAAATNLPLPLGPPGGLTCSKVQSPLAPTACNVQLQLAQVQSDGSVAPVNGQWVSPPAS